MNYQIVLTPIEDIALSFVTISQDDWIQNVIHERCRIAIDEIVQITVQKCLENNIQIPSSKDEMVELAFTQKWIEAVANKTPPTPLEEN